MMDSMLAALRSFTDAVTWEGATWALIRLTAILALGHLVLAVLARRTTAATRHLVAVATLGAAAVMPIASAVVPAGPALVVPAPVASAVPLLVHLAAQTPSVPGLQPVVANVTPSAVAQPSPSGAEFEPPATTIASARPLGSPRTAVLVLTLMAVAAGFLVRITVGIAASRRLFRDATPVTDERMRTDVERARRQFSIRWPVAVLTSRRVPIPMVVGLLRPTVLLPQHALAWSSERRRIVLTHELAHVSRHDGLALTCVRVATALLWFHPLAWKLAAVARRECERACDDVVLSGGVRASDYAVHLLAIARGASQPGPLPTLTLALAPARGLEDRLLALLRAGAPRGPATRRTRAAIACLALLNIVPVASLRVVASPQSPAVARYNELKDARSEDAGEWKSVGEALLRSGEEALSADAFGREYAIDHCPGSLYNIGCALAAGGEREQALSMLERAILEGSGTGSKFAADPDLIALHGDREYERLHALVNDLTLIDEGSDLDVWDDGSDPRRAEAWRRELPRFQRATRDHPEIGRAWFNLGIAQLGAREPKASMTSLNRALELGYQRGATTYHLAQAARVMSDSDQAVEYPRAAEVPERSLTVSGFLNGGSVR